MALLKMCRKTESPSGPEWCADQLAEDREFDVLFVGSVVGFGDGYSSCGP